MNKVIFKSFIIWLTTFIIAGCSEEPTKEMVDEVVVQLAWKHQAQFAGFYIAEQNGFYLEEHIQVELRPKLFSSFDVTNSVVKGDADFGVSYGLGLIEARANRLPVTAVASIYKVYPLSFISLKEKGITYPQDFSGKRMAAPSPGGASTILNLLLKKYAIDKNEIVFVQANYDLERFFSGEIDIWPAYTINEVILAKQRGYEINQVRPDDFGINIFGDILFTSDIILSTNPDLVKRLIRATLRGWQWAVDHPQEAARAVLQYDSNLNFDHQLAMMKASIPYVQTASPIGMMDGMIWKKMYDAVLGQGVIKTQLNIDTVYTNSFVEEIYKETDR